MSHRRTLIIGDIHGNVHALQEALGKAQFDVEQDRIICIGDYVDGWPNSFEVVRTLLEIQNQSPFENIFLLGNHDKWFRDVLDNDFDILEHEWLIEQKHPRWFMFGGKATYRSYTAYPDEFINIHKEKFFDKLRYYHIEDSKLFVHAGFPIKIGFQETLHNDREEFIWDRSLYRAALDMWHTNNILEKQGKERTSIFFENFDTIFIGHTQTSQDGIFTPTRMSNVINVDQGCKRSGILTIYEMETGKFYQSTRMK